MSNSKCTITINHLVCYAFIFASFFHVYSSGFMWIQYPKAKTYEEIGKSLALQWYFNLSENESHVLSELTFNDLRLAMRTGEQTKFSIRSNRGKFQINGTNDVIFTLFDAQPAFDGSFCLKLEYDINEQSSGIKPSKCTELFVYAKPLVDFSPNHVTLNVTDRLPLYCNATGKPQPDIIWKKADDPSTVAYSGWFNLSVTEPSVQGLYMCIANNSYGTNNKTFFVKVHYEPEIQYISNEQTISEGNTVLLYCNASGNPTPNITWVKKGTMEERLIRGQGSALLELVNISRADTADYICIAKNILGKTFNRTSLTVEYRPIETTLIAKPGLEVILGGELILNCTSSALPKVNEFKLYHISTSFVRNDTDGVFRIRNITSSESGEYKCVPSNKVGEGDPASVKIDVLVPPKLYESLPNRDITINESDTLQLRCKANGNPKPDISWTKDSTPIKLQSNTYEKENASRYDAGVYRCTANNSILDKDYEDHSEVNVIVNYRPIETTLTAKPGLEVILGGELILNCTSSALPKVNEFKLYQINTSFVRNDTDGVFRIRNITSSESGEYKCVPSNKLGEGDPASVKIDVLVPPKLYESLPKRNITINESDTLQLRCKANGNPKPDISWTKDSTPIKLQSNTYEKENASRYDAGVYRCTANNSIHDQDYKEYSEVNVIVNYAPEITYFTSSQTVKEENDVLLYCNATGQPVPRVQWFKESTPSGNASVTLKSVKLNDGGIYVCKASNLLGTKSATTELIIQYKPINTTITTNTGKYEVAIHETLLLNCSAQAFPSANWFTFNNNDSTLQNSSNNIYNISKKAWSPAEDYYCLARNILGEGSRANVTISFLEQPTFTKEPVKSLTVNETQTMKLMCLVRGTPKPNVTWTKDGSSEFIGTDEIFTKNNTNRSDTGTYRCTASNGVGRILEAEFSVVVNYKPINTRLISTTGRTGATLNESLTLNCSTQSVPLPHSYSFQVNGSALNRTSSDSSILTILKDEPFYDENYTCFATNLLGDGEKSNILTLTLFKRPVIYSVQENVTVSENDTLTLQCRASGKPRPGITWTKGNSTETIKTGDTYSKTKAEKCDAGVYRCTADNGVKESVSAHATVTVKSFPEVPKIRSIAISIPRIEVHWKQPIPNCSLPITGFIAQVKKKTSQEKWTECKARYDDDKEFWSCSFEELESSTTYTLQIFAKNRFGKGNPAEQEFETKEGGGGYSSDASKGGLSRNDYIVIGACVGGFFLLIIVIMIIKKLKTKHGESNLQLPIELREQEERQQTSNANNEIQNAFDGPMTASQETLEVNETEEKEKTFEGNVTEEKEAKDSAEDNKL